MCGEKRFIALQNTANSRVGQKVLLILFDDQRLLVDFLDRLGFSLFLFGDDVDHRLGRDNWFRLVVDWLGGWGHSFFQEWFDEWFVGSELLQFVGVFDFGSFSVGFQIVSFSGPELVPLKAHGVKDVVVRFPFQKVEVDLRFGPIFQVVPETLSWNFSKIKKVDNKR